LTWTSKTLALVNGRPRFAAIPVLLLVLAALVWAGSDPWKTKPFQQWDAADIKKIVTDSPWARVIRINAPWKSGQAADSSGSASGLKHGQGSGGSDDDDESSSPTQAAFIVRWVSSRTVRAAALRGAVLAGQLKEEEAERELAQPVEVYQVLVAGPDMKPFESADETILKNNTEFIAKKTKQKIAPSKVQISHSADGKKVQGVVFSFPRKSDTGESTISPDEKMVTFSCTVGAAKIEMSFDISKMQDMQGRDL
jgi:hypothetical protein